jgi:hypothetical protein
MFGGRWGAERLYYPPYSCILGVPSHFPHPPDFARRPKGRPPGLHVDPSIHPESKHQSNSFQQDCGEKGRRIRLATDVKDEAAKRDVLGEKGGG